MRNHEGIVIEKFNGLWARGDADSTPSDHFVDCNNIEYIESGFKTRPGIEPWKDPREDGTKDIVQMYTFNTAVDGLITLDSSGRFWHIVPETSTVFNFLTLAWADDFTMAQANGRAYINPFEIGGFLDFLYVYEGDGITPARKAGGEPPKDADGVIVAAAGAGGNVEAGIHIFGVVYETDSGFRTQIGPDTLTTFTASGTTKVDLSSIPVSPNTYVVARHIVASKAIDPLLYSGDTRGYELFFVPDGTINDNTSTTLTVNFFDSELLESAADLLDIMSEVPNGTGIGFYHNRLIITAQEHRINQARVSNPGNYEAFNAVDGLLLTQDDGLGLLNLQEYRDVLYLFKINETISYSDNGDVPSSWPSTIVDEGLGAGIHGVMWVDTRQGMNIEYIILLNYSGIFLFNGTFQKPEFSWKILDLWMSFDLQEKARRVKIYNDVLHQRLYINIPSLSMILMGDYANGLTPEAIRWTKWLYEIKTDTITLWDKPELLLIGSTGTIEV